MLQQTPQNPGSHLRRQLLTLACFFALFIVGSAAWALRLAGPALQSTAAVRVAADVMAEHAKEKVPPTYPPAAKEAGITGPVVMAAHIGTTGGIEKLTVVSGPEELQAAALDAVRQWRYEPFVVNGKPVAVETTVTINFELHD